MEKQKKVWKFFSWHTVFVVVVVSILNTVIWIGFHGIPLMGLPEKEYVKSVTIIWNGTEEKTVVDDENIEILVNSANLLNYRLWGETEEGPMITVIYHLENGDSISIEANNTTVWWHGRSHSLKKPEVFVKIIQGLYFD